MCTLQVVMTTLCRRCHSRPRVTGPFCARCDLARAPREGPRPVVSGRTRSSPWRRPAPTRAAPGSPEKVAVLADRAARGQALWHPLDPTRPAPRLHLPRIVRVSDLPRRDRRSDDTHVEDLLSRGQD